MNAQTLSQIKKDIRRFHAVIEPIANYWSNYRSITLSVLVQNMGLDTSNCVDYDHDKTVDELYTILDLIKGIAKYSDIDHFSNWVYEEIDAIIQGNVAVGDFKEVSDSWLPD